MNGVELSASKFQTDGLPLFTESKRSHRGLIRNLNLHLTDFVLGNLHVDRLNASIPDCHFDLSLAVQKRQIRISESEIGTGEVRVTASDLEHFILVKYPEIRRVSVKLDGDKIQLEGIATLLAFAVPFYVVAKLECTDGNMLHLVYPRVLIDGKFASEETRRLLLKTLDPVVNLDRDLQLSGAIRVKRLSALEGVLTVTGDATIPELPSILENLGHKRPQ